jgi:hypothetical protein
MFELLDLDQSGSVSFEEFHHWWTNMFVVSRWDTVSNKVCIFPAFCFVIYVLEGRFWDFGAC